MRHNHHFTTDQMCLLYDLIGQLADSFDNPKTRDRYQKLRRRFQPHGRWVEYDEPQKLMLLSLVEKAIKEIDNGTTKAPEPIKKKCREIFQNVYNRITFITPSDPRESE